MLGGDCEGSVVTVTGKMSRRLLAGTTKNRDLLNTIITHMLLEVDQISNLTSMPVDSRFRVTGMLAFRLRFTVVLSHKLFSTNLEFQCMCVTPGSGGLNLRHFYLFEQDLPPYEYLNHSQTAKW